MKRVVWLLPLWVFACSSNQSTSTPLDSGSGPHKDATTTFITAPEASSDGDSTPGVRPPPFDQGVWVESLAGSDTSGDGSFSNPFQSIGKAIATALTQTPKRVLLCSQDIFVENLSITTNNLEIYGGIDCRGGGYALDSTDPYSSIQPLATSADAANNVTGPVIAVSGVTTGVLISGVRVKSPSPITIGESAIAVSVVNSTGVLLSGDAFYAGDGAPGGTGAVADAATANGTAIGTISAAGYTVSNAGAGGASIGVLAFASTLTLDNVTIIPGTGGAGATGGGDGGPSIGLFYDAQSNPTITDTVLVLPGVGGSNGGGADGLSQGYYPTEPPVSTIAGD